jgi:succinate dehydrogenase / fumarate reductase flavoprotein subunit
VDGLEEPMPVKPGQHYAMGGIETNEFGETCVDGLYAIGECACASVHGANRLGGNALPELIVFGKRAGRHAAGEDMGEPEITTGKVGDYEAGTVDSPVELGEPDAGAVADGGSAAETGEEVVERTLERQREEIERLLEKDDGVQHAAIRADLQKSMTENVNVFREEPALKQALRDIREARDRYRDVYVADPSRTYNTDLIHTIETRNLLDVAEAITVGALARDEFRGAHWRKEAQERRDDVWLKHTMLSWNDGSPELWYKPVVLEGEDKTYEPKERSY